MRSAALLRGVCALVIVCQGASLVAPRTAASTRSLPLRATGSDGDTSLLLQAGEAKLSGILTVLLVVSNGQANAVDGASALEAATAFPPGGPVVIAAAALAGLYTLWKVQPVMAAVQAEVARQDAAAAARRGE